MIKNLADEESVSMEQLDHVLMRLAAMPQLDITSLGTHCLLCSNRLVFHLTIF